MWKLKRTPWDTRKKRSGHPRLVSLKISVDNRNFGRYLFCSEFFSDDRRSPPPTHTHKAKKNQSKTDVIDADTTETFFAAANNVQLNLYNHKFVSGEALEPECEVVSMFVRTSFIAKLNLCQGTQKLLKTIQVCLKATVSFSLSPNFWEWNEAY